MRSVYERGLEHIRDKEEMKKESHIIKHYFDKHEDEDLDNLEFGIKIVRTTKTAFNRQILESVLIQSSKTRNFILNSRSEYNRCALPRLTAKLGDDTYDKIDKLKKEEKKAELELEKKIRDMKVKKSKERREELSWKNQPAHKKRKITEDEYKIVLQEPKQQEKRKEPPDETKNKAERNLLPTFFPIFRNNDNKKKRMEEEEEEEKKESSDTATESTGEIEEIDWNKKLEEKEKRLEEEEKRRKERIELEKRLDKSYELLKLCRETLTKEGETWKASKERRDLERIKEEEKKERLMRANKKKEKTLTTIKKKEMQTKITENLKLMPENWRILIENRIEKERLLDLKEAREKI